MLEARLSSIKYLCEKKRIQEAESHLILWLNEDNEEWGGLVRGANVTKIFQYIKTVNLVEGEEANIDLISQEMTLGTEFIINKIKKPADLLFTVYHERNHILIQRLWRLRLCKLKAYLKQQYNKVLIEYIDLLMNHAEEAYINMCTDNLIPSSQFLERIFGSEGYNSIRSTNPDTEFWKSTTLLAFHSFIRDNGYSTSGHSIYRWTLIFVDYMLTISISKLSQILGKAVAPLVVSAADKGTSFIGQHQDEDQYKQNVMTNWVEVDKDKFYHKKDINRKAYTYIFPIDQNPLNTLLIDTSSRLMYEMHTINLTSADFQKIIGSIGGIFLTHAASETLHIEGSSPVIPSHISNRDMYYINNGYYPSMYIEKYSPKINTPLYHVYFDTSGSMEFFMGILPLIKNQLKYLMAESYYFSDEIFPIDRTFTLYATTTGTNFNAVAKHILDNLYMYVVIVSDGEDILHDQYKADLKKILKHLVYIHINKNPASGSDTWDVLCKDYININY